MYWEDSQLSECGIMLYLGVSLFLCNLRFTTAVCSPVSVRVLLVPFL